MLTMLAIVVMSLMVFAQTPSPTLPWRGVHGGVRIQVEWPWGPNGTSGFVAGYLADPYYYEYYYGIVTAAHLVDTMIVLIQVMMFIQ